MGLKPHQFFFQKFFSTNMVARRVQSFCILEGTTDLQIEQWLEFFCQFIPDIWWIIAENFKPISWTALDLLSFNWKILAVACLLYVQVGIWLTCNDFLTFAMVFVFEFSLNWFKRENKSSSLSVRVLCAHFPNVMELGWHPAVPVVISQAVSCMCPYKVRCFN